MDHSGGRASRGHSPVNTAHCLTALVAILGSAHTARHLTAQRNALGLLVSPPQRVSESPVSVCRALSWSPDRILMFLNCGPLLNIHTAAEYFITTAAELESEGLLPTINQWDGITYLESTHLQSHTTRTQALVFWGWSMLH